MKSYNQSRDKSNSTKTILYHNLFQAWFLINYLLFDLSNFFNQLNFSNQIFESTF